MTRFEFNQAIGGAFRHVLQCAQREENARQHAAAVREAQETMAGSIRDHSAADRAVGAAGGKTDAAIMEVSDQLFDHIYGQRAETTVEAQRLGATA